MPTSDTHEDIAWTASADGEAEKTTSTAIAFVFGSEVSDLKAEDISVKGDTSAVERGALSGGGARWSLELRSVAKQGAVKIAIHRAGIEAGEKTVAVHKEPSPAGWTAEADGEAGKAASTAIAFVFSREVPELTEHDISVLSMTGEAAIGKLSGGGLNWTLALDAVLTAGDLAVSINREGIAAGEKLVAVYKQDETADISYTAEADGETDVLASTAIAFVFSGAVADLTAEDISVTNGTGEVVAGELSGGGTSWTLALDLVKIQGTVMVAISRAGIDNSPVSVAVYRRSTPPPTPGRGTLVYAVIVPEGVVPEAGSRIRIEQDGAVLASLNSGGFQGGQRQITESIGSASVQLDPGWYTVDMAIAGPGDTKAVFHELVEIKEGKSKGLRFEPPADAFLTTTEAVEDIDNVSVPSFVVLGSVLDLTGAKVKPAGATHKTIVWSVKDEGGTGVSSADLADGKATPQNAGTLVARATIVQGKSATEDFTKDFAIDVRQPTEFTALITIKATTANSSGLTLVGSMGGSGASRSRALSAPNAQQTVFITALKKASQTLAFSGPDGAKVSKASVYTDGDTPGPGRDVLIVDLAEKADWGGVLNFVITVEESGKLPVTYAITLDILLARLPESEARLFFPYGGRLDDDAPQRNRYTVTEGRSLVIAPVLWRIPSGAAFQWTVSGNAVTASNGEFLTFQPGTPAGNYSVTVTASFDGRSVSASAAVECVNVSSPPSENREYENGYLAPGQNAGTWRTSLGGFGGSVMRELSVDNEPGDDIYINGNAFGTWVEPGIVWVMKDENRNGKADDTWYELKGNAAELYKSVTRRYAVAYYKNGGFWEDSLGNTGKLGALQRYPSSLDKITLAGTLIDLSASAVSDHLLQGYVDVLDNCYDISDAIQADGSSVYLDHIDFVRIQTAEHTYDNLFGEKSTEIDEMADKVAISPVWVESRSFIGAGAGGGYAYSIVNDSGYDLTISFRGITETLFVPQRTTASYTSTENKLYFNFNGGNVTQSVSGNTLTFTNG
jgi:hypothetical protein